MSDVTRSPAAAKLYEAQIALEELPASEQQTKVALLLAELDALLPSERPEDGECRQCLGCGQVADTDEQEPWSLWLDLPLKSSAAVLMGMVRPIPCPACNALSAVCDE